MHLNRVAETSVTDEPVASVLDGRARLLRLDAATHRTLAVDRLVAVELRRTCCNDGNGCEKIRGRSMGNNHAVTL